MLESIVSYIELLPWYISLVACVWVIIFIYQLYYYIFVIGRVGRYKGNNDSNSTNQPISIVVVVNNNRELIEKNLPLLLAQDYSAFEVVVVANDCDEDVIVLLDSVKNSYSNFKYTGIKADRHFRHTPKLFANLGLKAASYENILFTDFESYPVSKNWLSQMAAGFDRGDVVIGYSGLERKKGAANSFMRCTKFMVSMRYLSSALAGRTYKGTQQNIGYKKELYFENNGFTHLRLNVGLDDLFIQKIARKDNTTVVINHSGFVRERQCGGLRWWRGTRMCNTYTFQFYPKRVKFKIFTELLCRFLFFLITFALIAWGALEQNILVFSAAILLLVLRLITVLIVIFKCSKRVGDRGLINFYFIYDFISPLSECFLSIKRRLKPVNGLWN